MACGTRYVYATKYVFWDFDGFLQSFLSFDVDMSHVYRVCSFMMFDIFMCMYLLLYRLLYRLNRECVCVSVLFTVRPVENILNGTRKPKLNIIIKFHLNATCEGPCASLSSEEGYYTILLSICMVVRSCRGTDYYYIHIMYYAHRFQYSLCFTKSVGTDVLRQQTSNAEKKKN